MAVSPLELQALTPEDVANIKKLELIIDEKLSTGYEPGGQVRLNLVPIAEAARCRVTFKMRKELLSRYEAVGWIVMLESTPTAEYVVFNGPAMPKEAEIVPNISTDDMIKKMQDAVINPPTTHKPPVFTSASRDDKDLPYNRTKLA